MYGGLDSYSLLSRLPLFQGMSGSEFDDIISHVRLGFSKTNGGETVVVEGDSADRLVFVVKGEVVSEVFAADHGYSVAEVIHAPCVLQPEALFGLTQRYTKTFRAVTQCNLLSISKADAVSLTTTSEVFRINVLNTLCAMTQKLQRMPWRVKPQSVRQKIFSFVGNRCSRPAGHKVVNIGMVRLGNEISESRLNVSRELKALHNEGLIIQKRNSFIIPALEKLI